MSEDYDEVTRLRLRLSHVEAQRDAFEAALRKEVLAVIREEIAKALSPKMIEATWVVSHQDAERLKAENERLRASSFVTAVPSEHYERVIKAGDAVVNDLEYLTKSGWFNKCKSVKAWNAAKEGKQS